MAGAKSYTGWINADLYERTEEQFGICNFPGMIGFSSKSTTTNLIQFIESLQIHLGMKPFSSDAVTAYAGKINSSDDWLRRRQGVALPVLPPTTPEARQYFFTQIRHFAAIASENGKGKINFERFAFEWNQSADGKNRVYVMTEVLSAYARTWEKASNARASQEIISDQIQEVQQSYEIFAAANNAFPDLITDMGDLLAPNQGVLDMQELPAAQIPASVSIEPTISRGGLPAAREVALPTRKRAIELPDNSNNSR